MVPSGEVNVLQSMMSALVKLSDVHTFFFREIVNELQFFPLREPLHVPSKATINCSMWRRSDSERVWYEWCVEVVSNTEGEEVVLSTGHVHNPEGRSYHVRL